jgi:hypothetical protein
MFWSFATLFRTSAHRGDFALAKNGWFRVRMPGWHEIEQPASVDAGSMEPKVLVKNKNMAPPSNTPNPPLPTIEASPGVINRN